MKLLLGLLVYSSIAFSLIGCNDASNVKVSFYNSSSELIGKIEVETVSFHLRQSPGIETPKRQMVYYQ